MSAESEYREEMITRIADALEVPRDIVAAAAHGESVVERSRRQAEEVLPIAEQVNAALERPIDMEIMEAMSRPVDPGDQSCSCFHGPSGR